MENNAITLQAKGMEEIFETVMKMYWVQINALETFIKKIPETDEVLIKEMNQLMDEVQVALEHDIGIFTKAVNADAESLHGIQDQLKIHDIYSKLNKQ